MGSAEEAELVDMPVGVGTLGEMSVGMLGVAY